MSESDTDKVKAPEPLEMGFWKARAIEILGAVKNVAVNKLIPKPDSPVKPIQGTLTGVGQVVGEYQLRSKIPKKYKKHFDLFLTGEALGTVATLMFEGLTLAEPLIEKVPLPGFFKGLLDKIKENVMH